MYIRKLLVGALTVLGVASMCGVAGAYVQASAPVQENNQSCGQKRALPDIGTASFTRIKDTVKVRYALTHGTPNTQYVVELWGGKCEDLGQVTTFTTNENGVGAGSGKVQVPAGISRFFATGHTAAGYNDSLLVSLPAGWET